LDETAEQEHKRRGLSGRRIAAGLLLVVVLILGIAWLQRRDIATGFIDRELDRRGVTATYRVARIGPTTQRLENLVLGDPARPDLTARWVEVRLAYGWRGPRVAAITARGVRVAGRVVDGKLRLGEIDKMLPPPSGAPFRLPDQIIDIADTAMTLDTPAGRIGLGFEGNGKLSNGFRGKIAAVAPRLLVSGCAMDGARAFATIGITGRRPSVEGPLSARRLACAGPGFDILQPRLALDLTLAEALDSWIGESELSAPRAAFGAATLASVAGTLGFTGNGKLTRGAVALNAAGGNTPDFRAARLKLDGRYSYSATGNRLTLLGDGEARNIVAYAGALRPLTGALASARGTPLAPLGAALAGAVQRAGQGFDARGGLRLVNGRDNGALRIERLDAASRSGARLALSGGEGLTYYWPSGRLRTDGQFALVGGGFPETRLSLRQAQSGGAVSGEARIAAFAAGGARLQLAPVRFAASPGGETRIETAALLDGPFGDGRVEGLLLPIVGRFGRGGFAFGERCAPVSFRALRISGLALGPTRLPLCPTGRALVYSSGNGAQADAEVRAPRLAGRLGSTPIRIAADRFRFGTADFAGANVAVRLGEAGRVSELDLASLDGRFAKGAIAGTFGGGAGRIANVPLLLSGAGGRWTLKDGDLAVDAALTVADAAPEPRFYPLAGDDFRLTLADNRIAAAGWLKHPQTGSQVTRVEIAHQLGSGAGNAILDVPGIAFTEAFQPEQLTRLTTGIVALVRGTVKGRGEIAWSPDGVTSGGSFSTEAMNLAANFGPVTGLSTTIDFTDLLGLQSAPGQQARIAQIQTGIDVFDGLIRYQLLPGLKVRVESGRWPFAGGDLLLEETILDFSQPTAKRLTFLLAGLDAAAFVQQLQFNNISATGTFDGRIPMIFDANGGRIVGGRLEARTNNVAGEDGGTLSYIGELTDKQLGAYGKLAFDALKSLRYDKLDINLDGSLDGEFVTRIELDGIARNTGPQPGIVGAVIKRLAALRFEFNINVKGPFRSLLATARSLEDPSMLIQSVLPEVLKDQPVSPTVQPEESEIVQ